jgi:hypothetical protein
MTPKRKRTESVRQIQNRTACLLVKMAKMIATHGAAISNHSPIVIKPNPCVALASSLPDVPLAYRSPVLFVCADLLGLFNESFDCSGSPDLTLVFIFFRRIQITGHPIAACKS